MNIYEARWLNAQRVAKKLQSWIDKGWLLFDNENCRVRKIELTEFGMYRIVNPSHRVVMFENDKEYDHGLHTTVRDFNAQFDSWYVCKPTTYNVIGRRRRLEKGD